MNLHICMFYADDDLYLGIILNTKETLSDFLLEQSLSRLARDVSLRAGHGWGWVMT